MKYWLVIFTLLVCCYQTIGQTNVDVVRAESETPVTTMPDKQAEFPGGTSALIKFLRSNFNFKITDSLICSKFFFVITIDENGSAANPKILKECFDTDYNRKELQRVVNLMPKWEPAVMNGTRAKSLYNIPMTICFK